MGNTFQETGGIETTLFDFGRGLSEEGFKKGLHVIARSNGLDEESLFSCPFSARHRQLTPDDK